MSKETNRERNCGVKRRARNQGGGLFDGCSSVYGWLFARRPFPLAAYIGDGIANHAYESYGFVRRVTALA